MLIFALNKNDARTFIDESNSNEEYYFPDCATILNTKKGSIKRHHFAHKKGSICLDSWERNGSYDTSEWHDVGQSKFPYINQEVKVTLGDISYRADILVGKIVIGFQHSDMREKL